MSIIKDLVERLLFPNRDPHTIPVLDGPFSANTLLDTVTPVGPVLAEADDFLILPGPVFLVSAPEGVFRLEADGARLLLATPAPAGALAMLPDGSFAVALDGDGVLGFDAQGREIWRLAEVSGRPLRSVTAMVPDRDGSLLLTEGSARNRSSDWLVDLMQANAPTGRVIRLGAGGRDAQVLVGDLAWPGGVLPTGDGRLWVSESWTHRLLQLDPDSGKTTAVIRNFAGYPGRMAPAGDGFAMTFMALRTELTEFVLKERAFCERMMAQVPREYWIGPALRSRGEHLAPTQMGGIKKLGIEKAWAPPRSYGLVALFDAHGEAVASLHSRVAGRFHGVTSVRQSAGAIYALSRGEGRLALLPDVNSNSERGVA